MNQFFTAWLLTLGLGSGSVHTDFNKNFFSKPGFASEINFTAVFDKQYLGFGLNFRRNQVLYSNWSRIYTEDSQDHFNLQYFQVNIFTGGDLISFSEATKISGFGGVSLTQNLELGLNGSLLLSYTNRKILPRTIYYLKFETDYWGSDLLEDYQDSKNGHGDFYFGLVVGLQFEFETK
tara:strand:- start:3175 stop:3708 length:534 start_codon:yes stop_codon:yes gene_type:complete